MAPLAQRLILQQHSLNIASYKAVQNFEKLCFGNIQYIFDDIEYIQELYLDLKWKTRSFESRLVRCQLEWLIPHHTPFSRSIDFTEMWVRSELLTRSGLKVKKWKKYLNHCGLNIFSTSMQCYCIFTFKRSKKRFQFNEQHL